MSNHAHHSPAPSRHHRPKPGLTVSSAQESLGNSPTAPSEHDTSIDWQAALRTLEQHHGDRLAQIEERLAATERATTDLGGQIKEMR